MAKDNGFDAEYFNEGNPSLLMMRALKEDRLIVTRNHRLIRPGSIKTVLIDKGKIREQVAQIIKKLNIKVQDSDTFIRCTVCNKELVKIEKEKIKEKVPEYVFETQNEFVTCPACGRIYWRGTHWRNVIETLQD